MNRILFFSFPDDLFPIWLRKLELDKMQTIAIIATAYKKDAFIVQLEGFWKCIYNSFSHLFHNQFKRSYK